MSAGSSAAIGISSRAGTKAFPAECGAVASRTLIGMPIRSAAGTGPWWRWYRCSPRAMPATNVSFSVPPIVWPTFLAMSRGMARTSKWLDRERPVMIGDRGVATGRSSRAAEDSSSLETIMEPPGS
jgi:hypothetical protein